MELSLLWRNRGWYLNNGSRQVVFKGYVRTSYIKHNQTIIIAIRERVSNEWKNKTVPRPLELDNQAPIKIILRISSWSQRWSPAVLKNNNQESKHSRTQEKTRNGKCRKSTNAFNHPYPTCILKNTREEDIGYDASLSYITGTNKK